MRDGSSALLEQLAHRQLAHPVVLATRHDVPVDVDTRWACGRDRGRQRHRDDSDQEPT
jgi:hypothetical protein